jgi:inosine-uridine nucleoside N-ribohydrolase
MGGSFFAGQQKREWNALVDPIATAIVYKAPVPRHISIGLDVTMKCQMAAKEMRQRFREPPLDVVAEMAEVWFGKTDMVTFHDPLAAATIFRPDLCTYADGKITVPLDADEEKCGRTVFAENTGGNPHRVAKEVKVDEFFREYFGVFQ